jgi:NAD(P)-dependent dehydrogenase (short-subunit alcohol dehydrogenase family)
MAIAPDAFANASFEGKVALITGGSQGLGERIAHTLADRGAAGIAICSRTPPKGEAVRAALEAKGVKAIYVQADVGSVEDCRAAVAACDKAFGRLDALVNAAAKTDRGTILDTDQTLFDDMFAINVRGPFFLTQEAAKIMIRDGRGGTVVNIISMSGHGGQTFISAYCASKGALLTLTKNAAFSLMRHKIRVNGLTIGWMDTPAEDAIMRKYHGAQDGWKEKAEAGLPWGRMLKTDEVARAVAYLSTPDSGLMSGSIIDFDQQVLGCAESAPQPPPL